MRESCFHSIKRASQTQQNLSRAWCVYSCSEARLSRGEPAAVVGFGTDFDGEVTHLFLSPANLCFRKLLWYETLVLETVGKSQSCMVSKMRIIWMMSLYIGMRRWG